MVLMFRLHVLIVLVLEARLFCLQVYEAIRWIQLLMALLRSVTSPLRL